MGLIPYTNLEDGNPAGANDINQRFGDVLAQVNGNLDEKNIKNGSLTRELFSPDAVLSSWPVNSVYLSVEDVNPSTVLGGGTWVKIAEGQALVGVNPADTDFDAAEKTAGSKTVSLTAAQNGPHTHSVDPPATSTNHTGDHTHGMNRDAAYTDNSTRRTGPGNAQQAFGYGGMRTDTAGGHSHTVDIPAFNSASSGTGAPVNIVQPSFALFVWKRVA